MQLCAMQPAGASGTQAAPPDCVLVLPLHDVYPMQMPCLPRPTPLPTCIFKLSGEPLYIFIPRMLIFEEI
jgi:hypothetical protein